MTEQLNQVQRSPAQQHYARVLAQRAAAASQHGQPVQGDAYDLMCAKLATDRQRLKQIQSIQRKIDIKRELLPDYREWIDAALSADKGAQDLVLTTVLVWHIDVGDYERALEIAAYCLRHDLRLPDQYNRTLPTMLLDEIPGAYLAGKFGTQSGCPTPALDILHAVQELTAQADVPDQARAKLYKTLGYALIGKVGNGEIEFDHLADVDASQALTHLRRALDLFQGIGVKKDIERLERRLKKTADADAPA